MKVRCNFLKVVTKQLGVEHPILSITSVKNIHLNLNVFIFK